ncbi:uncharacterized protein LOC131028084 [Cryptomeria japonica]|uniref:uncharacterized protein LOC131028084 n=1 Tax=Cryptomeria japonica TaxID=3369 RepID=UPI0025AC1233|nr:uncharacterized protein LOC131028084 [Cryptomeria japonica]
MENWSFLSMVAFSSLTFKSRIIFISKFGGLASPTCSAAVLSPIAVLSRVRKTRNLHAFEKQEIRLYKDSVHSTATLLHFVTSFIYLTLKFLKLKTVSTLRCISSSYVNPVLRCKGDK